MKEYMNDAADGERFAWECVERDEKAIVGRLVAMLAVPVDEGWSESRRTGRGPDGGEVEGNQLQGGTGGDVNVEDHEGMGEKKRYGLSISLWIYG